MLQYSKIFILVAALALCAIGSGCKSSGTNSDVWDNYNIPIDNDAYYTPPKGFGICGADDAANFGCE